MLEADYPGTVFLQSNENLGFAGANNYAAEKAQGEYLLFLNPDTEVVGNAIAGILSTARNSYRAGVVGCRLLNTDGTLQMSCVQPFPTVLNQALESNVLFRIFPGLPLGNGSRMLLDQKSPVAAQVISGACLMVRKSVFDEVGGFSPEYFMYTEDVDLCYKIHSAGYINYYTGSVSVIHHGGGSSQKRAEHSFTNVQMRASIFKFLEKTRGRFYASLFRAAMFLSGIVRLCMISAAMIPCIATGQYARCRNSFRKWSSIIQWTVGLEKWAR
jgi:GT2 family glycosyltransferase